MVFSCPNFYCPHPPQFEIWMMHLLCNCDSLSDGCRAACLSHFGTDDRENKLGNHIVGDHLLTYPDLCESDSPSKEWQDIFVPLLLCCHVVSLFTEISHSASQSSEGFLFWNFITVRFKVIQNWYVRLLCCYFFLVQSIITIQAISVWWYGALSKGRPASRAPQCLLAPVANLSQPPS